MTTQVERIERTGWVTAAVLAAGSVLFRSLPVSAGVALGALVALLSFRALCRFASGLLAAGAAGLPRLRFALHLGKYALIAAVLAAAIRFRIADAVAVLVGASVLLPAIVREALAARARPLPHRRPD